MGAYFQGKGPARPMGAYFQRGLIFEGGLLFRVYSIYLCPYETNEGVDRDNILLSAASKYGVDW